MGTQSNPRCSTCGSELRLSRRVDVGTCLRRKGSVNTEARPARLMAGRGSHLDAGERHGGTEVVGAVEVAPRVAVHLLSKRERVTWVSGSPRLRFQAPKRVGNGVTGEGVEHTLSTA